MWFFDLLRDRLDIHRRQAAIAELRKERDLLLEELRIKNTLWDSIDAMPSNAPSPKARGKKARRSKSRGRK